MRYELTVCSEDFVHTVYKAIKAAASLVRASGNLVLQIPWGGLKSHPEKQSTPRGHTVAK